MTNLDEAVLSSHRVEIIRQRGKEQTEIKPFDNERSAKNNFDGLAHKEFKHILAYWSFSSLEIITTFNLYQNNELTESITIKAGTHEKD